MPRRPKQYIDGLLDELCPDSAGRLMDLDDLRAFAEKVYRYAMRNRKRESTERVIKEMLKEPEET